jgi:hypothetical protein
MLQILNFTANFAVKEKLCRIRLGSSSPNTKSDPALCLMMQHLASSNILECVDKVSNMPDVATVCVAAPSVTPHYWTIGHNAKRFVCCVFLIRR